MARRRTAAGKVDARIPPFPCRTSSDVTRPFRNKSGTALEGQEEGLSGVGPPPCVFFLLEIVAVADASVDRAGPVTDVRVSVHENGCLRSHRRAQPVSKLQCRQIHFLSTHALREAGLPSKDTFVPPPASQVLPAFTRISASASRSKMLLPTRPIHQ